jgi:hypothetical protein
MDQTETLIAQSHQCIRESYLAIRHLCASVARANEAIAKSLKIIEQHRVSAPAMMDRADEATPVRDHHQVSRKAAIGKMTIDSDSRQMAARIIQGLREAGFGCELLSQPRPLLPLPLMDSQRLS